MKLSYLRNPNGTWTVIGSLGSFMRIGTSHSRQTASMNVFFGLLGDRAMIGVN